MKIAVISGGSRGIGYALSVELVKNGFKVYSISRSLPERKIFGVEYLLADISREIEVEKAVLEIEDEIDLLVNNAGVMRRGKYFEISEEDFDLVWEVNVKGFWLMFKHLKGKLKKGAMTLQVNSKNSLLLKEDTFVYTLSKLADLEIDKMIKKDRGDLVMKVAHLGPVDTELEWTGYSEEQKAEKMKVAISAEEAARRLMEMLG